MTTDVDPAGGLPTFDPHKRLELLYTSKFKTLLLEKSNRFVCQREGRRDIDEGVDLDVEVARDRQTTSSSMTNLLIYVQLKVATDPRIALLPDCGHDSP